LRVSAAEEHLANDPTSELWGEHRARYRFAGQWARGCRVLDVACGAGFGLQLLEQAGAYPIGMDLDPRALAEAHALEPEARLVRADAARLPLPDASFDLVTSFETLEHVPDACALLSELRRVLRPGGRLVLSTPNRAFGPPEHHQNPFHVREFEADELRQLLQRTFSTVHLFSQRPSSAYRYVPYLLVEPGYAPAELAWKLLNRLPFRLKNAIALALSGRPFYPGETDYCFVESPAAVPSHVLVAVAVAE
jgi:SAM-dependent methyltransferase